MMYCQSVWDQSNNSPSTRVLIEADLPPGLSSEILQIDIWFGQLAPLPALAQWYTQHPDQAKEFSTRYRQQLVAYPEPWLPLLNIARQGHVTLLYGAASIEHSHAPLLADFLEEELDKWQEASSPVCYAHLHNLL